MIDPAQIDPARLAANWRAITIELDVPKPTRLERVLRFVRLPVPAVRMVAATPALRRSWYLSIVTVVLIGLSLADPADPDSVLALFLMAPLLPVLGVALAYGSAVDPSHEIQLATPTHGLRLVTIRAAVVLTVSVAVVFVLSLLNEAVRAQAAAWLLPAVAVTSVSIAVMTVRPPRQATSLVALGWFLVVMIARGAANDPLAAFSSVGQLVALVVAIVAAVAAYWRRDRFERLELAA